jgi:formate transporter
MNDRPTSGIDSLLPHEMALRAEDIGVKKASMAFEPLFALSILAGAFIGFGAALSTTAAAGADGMLPYGVVRLISGFVFSLGLVLVVIGGAELFTGNNLIVMAWANGRVSTLLLLRNWLIVYLGNFVGAVGIAILVFFGGHYLFGGGTVGMTALAIADTKTAFGFGEAFVLGILCNILVCLAVWMSYSGRTTVDKVVAVVPPITAFVALGFEHSIANMYFIPYGLLVKYNAGEAFWGLIGSSAGEYPGLNLWHFVTNNLVPVTLGNIIGGAVLVGIVYWFVYLRDREKGEK